MTANIIEKLLQLQHQVRLVDEQTDSPSRLYEQEDGPGRLYEQEDGPGRLQLPNPLNLVQQGNGPGRLSEQEECTSSLQLQSQLRLVGPSRFQLQSQIGLVVDGQDEETEGTTKKTIEQVLEMHAETPTYLKKG